MAVPGILAACESPGPANPLPPDAEREAVAGALESVAEGHRSRLELARAGGRGRWSDVENALRWAIAEEGVEMGLLATRTLPDGFHFELITVEGWPAALTVRQTGDDRIYAATATVGRFPELIDRSARANALLEAFDNWMATLGAKPQLVPAE